MPTVLTPTGDHRRKPGWLLWDSNQLWQCSRSLSWHWEILPLTLDTVTYHGYVEDASNQVPQMNPANERIALRTSELFTDKHWSDCGVGRSVRSLEAGGCLSRSAFSDFCEGSAGLSADIKRRIAALTLPSSKFNRYGLAERCKPSRCLTLESAEALSALRRLGVLVISWNWVAAAEPAAAGLRRLGLLSLVLSWNCNWSTWNHCQWFSFIYLADPASTKPNAGYVFLYILMIFLDQLTQHPQDRSSPNLQGW